MIDGAGRHGVRDFLLLLLLPSLPRLSSCRLGVRSALLDQNFLSENPQLLENFLKNVDTILSSRKSIIEAWPDERWTGGTSERSLGKGVAKGDIFAEVGCMELKHRLFEKQMNEEFLKQKEVLRWKEQDRI